MMVFCQLIVFIFFVCCFRTNFLYHFIVIHSTDSVPPFFDAVSRGFPNNSLRFTKPFCTTRPTINW